MSAHNQTKSDLGLDPRVHETFPSVPGNAYQDISLAGRGRSKRLKYFDRSIKKMRSLWVKKTHAWKRGRGTLLCNRLPMPPPPSD